MRNVNPLAGGRKFSRHLNRVGSQFLTGPRSPTFRHEPKGTS